MVSNGLRRLLAGAYWIGLTTVLVVVVGFMLGFAVGGSLLSVKYTLFVLGMLLFGLGSLLFQPPSPRSRSIPRRIVGRLPAIVGSAGTDTDDLTDSHGYRIDALVQRLPPFSHDPVPPDRRIGRPQKVFVTGLVVLAISFGMEFVFGVAV